MKITIQLASLILVVEHNLCYWMSNKLCTTSNFSKLQYTPKFTDNQKFTDIDKCIFIYMHIFSYMRSFLLQLWFSVYSNYIHIQIFVKTTCNVFQ
jgi:hypothetical protein